jgi:menaquinone-specific isochorismate synthase
MKPVEIATPGHPAEAWRRCAAPGREQVRDFLHCGAAFAWSDDRWIIGWGAPEKSARPDPDRPSFYAPDFFLADPAPWLLYPHAAAVSPDGLAQHLDGEIRPRVWRGFDAGAFASAFAKVGGALGRGELRKAVPVVFETCDRTLDEADRARALRAMANLPSGLMPYGCWDRATGVLGASPELLFGDDGVEIHTMAVAGTARAGAAPDEMMDDPKERSEHSIVLEDLAEQLAPLGPVTRGATRLWRIGILSHLRTDLRLTPSAPVAFDELVRRLHPTPAVGTAPRERWREWLPQIDSAPRGHFAAPFGLALPGGTARCLVGIRNVQWDAHGARCGAGCGLVPASKLERETAELRLKLAATRGNLGL